MTGVNIGLTMVNLEKVASGLPGDPAQLQSSSVSSKAHKAGIPIAAIAGAAAGGLVALLIGKPLLVMLLVVPCHLPLHSLERKFFGLPHGCLDAPDLMLSTVMQP